MTKPIYKTVSRTQGNNRALKEGLIKPDGFDFDFIEVNPLVAGFRRMVRQYEFDICEMAITTYLCAKSYGKKLTAIPVPLVRGFHTGTIMVNKKASIATPKDLEGRCVGVNRGYTVTSGVWARAALTRDYGVDLSKITWVLSGDEHVVEYKAPANVVPMDKSRTMAEHLIAGDLAAAIGIEVDHPDIAPLIPKATESDLTALKTRGYYPINHLVVIKTDLIEAQPGLATEVFNLFSKSKKLYIEALRSGRITNPDAVDSLHLKVMETMTDPLPYGIEPNRAVIEELMENVLAQGIIKTKTSVDNLFAPETRHLLG